MEFNSILHQKHCNVSRYTGSFIWKETRLSLQHSYNLSTLLQVYYLKIKQQAQPIYIPQNFSLHKQTLRLYSLQKTLAIVSTTSPTSPYLPKYDRNNIHNDIKFMADKHKSYMKNLNNHISAILAKPTDTSFKTDKQEQQLKYISSKISTY